MMKLYSIVRNKFQWKLLLITILMFIYPSICEANFTSYGTNSVTNGSAETGDLTGWTLVGSGFSSYVSGSDPSPKEGTHTFDFYSASNSSATLSQIISLSAITSDISAGKVKAVLTGSIDKLYGETIGYILLEELNSGGSVLNSSQADCATTGTWDDKTITIPLLNTATTQIRITLYGKVTGGGDYCDFDAINLVLYRWPTVTNTAASTITTSSAVLGGNVTTDGSPANTERGVVYSTTDATPTIGETNVTKLAIGSGSGTFSSTISGLSGAQTYYYNAYATNTLGTVYGTASSFTTLTPTYLTATTSSATNVTINSATLNGSVNANGRTTDCYFQYGTTTSYGTQVAGSPSTASGTSATTETASLTGLANSTTYHFRMAAYNATEGWKYGSDNTFTTLTPVPEMDLKQSSTAIADGGSYDFGNKILSSNTDIVFTIQNTGTSALTLTTPITIGGSNADQFSIQAQPTSPVAAAGSTTFTIRFSPTSSGSKTASISIGNNDSNENPYDLTITGQGYAAPTVTTGVQTINTQGVNVNSVLTPVTITTLKGSVNANNASTAVTFEYGTTIAYGTSVTATVSPVTGTTATSVTCTPTLLPNTTYHYRVVGVNTGGTTYGADQTFTTPVIEHFTGETTDYAQTFAEGGTTFTMTGYLFDKYDPLGGCEGPDCFYDAQMISNLYNIMPSAGIVGSIKNATNNFYVNNFWIAAGNASYTFGQYGNVIVRGKRSGTTLFTYTLTSANTNANYAVNNNYTYIDLSSYNSVLIDELEFEVTDNIRYLKIDAFNFNYPAAFVPTVATQAVNSIGVTTATGNGNITNLGNPNPTAYGVCWSTTSGAETATGSNVNNGTASATGAFIASMTGLAANTTYYVKAYATNSAGTVYGSEVSFTTLAIAPTITTQAVTNVLAATATGNGNITSLGIPNPSAYGVCWSTTSGAETATGTHASNGSASATGAFTASMTGLTANTTYYVKAYATNTAGTVYGSEVTFKTLTPGTWTGNAGSSYWTDANNWAGGAVPTSTTDVIIPSSGITYLPMIFATDNAECNNLTTADGYLEVLSSSSGTGSLIVHGTVSGKVWSDVYFNANQWHIVTPPVNGGDIGSFLSNSSNAISNQINGATTTYSIADYSESTNVWNSYFTNATGGTFASGKGYLMRHDNNDYVSFYGNLITGTKTVSLTKAGQGWNCIGNPYTSAIGMNASASSAENFLTKNSSIFDPSYACVYIWDGVSSSYKILGNLPSGLSAGSLLTQNYVQVGQAFFVKAKDAGQTATFSAAMQSHQNNTYAPFKAAAITTIWPAITLTATGTTTNSSVLVAFNGNMTNGLDPGYDAGLLRGTNGLSLYTRLVEDNGVDFAVQCLPENYTNLIVPVGVDCNAAGNITFSAESVNLPATYNVVLEDRASNTFTSLTGGSTYKTTVSAGSTAVGRFYIRTSNNTATGTSESGAEISNIKAYIANDEIIIAGKVSGRATATLYNLQGLKIQDYSLQEGSFNTIACSQLMNGVYLLTIDQNGQKVTRKLIKK